MENVLKCTCNNTGEQTYLGERSWVAGSAGVAGAAPTAADGGPCARRDCRGVATV